jgi:hypothetical protein
MIQIRTNDQEAPKAKGRSGCQVDHSTSSKSRNRLIVARSSCAPLGPPAVNREQVVLDFAIENLKLTQGIEFATSQQLRLIGQAGSRTPPTAVPAFRSRRSQRGFTLALLR